MKKNYALFLVITGATIFTAFQGASKKYTQVHKPVFGSGGSGLGARTGAPGEGNCTACHAGSTQDGASENQFVMKYNGSPVTSYIAGETYTLELAMASDPAKKGFEATVFDATNAFVGSFTSGASTQVFTINSKNYASHKSSSNTSSTPTWSWTWTAPANDVGDVTFYIASNKANNNGSTSGDVIYLSQHTFNSETGIKELKKKTNDFKVGYSAKNNELVISFSANNASEFALNLVDLSGKSVFTSQFKKSFGENQKVVVPLTDEIGEGMYVVHLFADNYPMSANVMITK